MSDYYGGAKRAPSKWNMFVTTYAKECRASGIEFSMKQASIEAKRRGNILSGKQTVRSVCSQKTTPANNDRANCLQNDICSWREQTYTKGGNIRKGFCTKGIRPKTPRYEL